MEAASVSGSKSLQLRITDYFHTLHVLLTESESFCPFHQSLITDYYQEIELSIVFSESYSDGRSTVLVLIKSVLQPLTSIKSKPPAIPFCEPQTLVSKFVPSDTSHTHVSETPEI